MSTRRFTRLKQWEKQKKIEKSRTAWDTGEINQSSHDILMNPSTLKIGEFAP